MANQINGKTFAFTGTLESMSRKEAHEKVTAMGGRVVCFDIKAADYVVTGQDCGSKSVKARALGIPVLDEYDFMQLVTAQAQ